ncbi:acyl carrier protein, partial [Campylobacter jejuni]
MQNTVDLIKQFFINIDRADIDENMENLLSEDIIDSIDIMSLVAEIEKFYKKPLKAEFI